MGSLCGKTTREEEPTTYKGDQALGKHLQTKKDIREAFKNGKISGSEIFDKYDEEATSSYEDIRKVYIFDKKELGKGHFGSVRRAKLQVNQDKMYAVKTINKEKLGGDLYLLKRELEILRNCDHPNIAKFYESYQDERFFHFVLEHCAGGDLVTKIMKLRHLEEPVVKRLMFQI
jgi:calcium-dependent protein kinase